MTLVAVLAAAPAAICADAERQIRLRQAEALIERGLYDEAAGLLDEAAADDPAAQALRGRALALARRYLAAETPLRGAVEAGERDPVTLFYLGATLWENGRLEEAGAVYGEAIATAGRHPVFVHQLGRLELWRGNYARAAELLSEAVAGAGGSLEMRLDLARALEATGDLAPALAQCRAVVAAAPDHSGARYTLARLLLASGDREAGDRELVEYRRLHEREQAETRASGRAAARVARGLAYLHQGDAAAAVDYLETLPETAETLAALASALSARGEPRAAVAALEKAVRLAPERQDLRHRLAETRLAAGEPRG